ncbi:MAG: FAD:protein FMN transferase [Ancrocorticia sp.]|nr:FAD:protein FMN transferase [Ancrocorticia sp.]MCI2003027.1 FAD:protein FMN transferase [Ancrocorticia sp.]
MKRPLQRRLVETWGAVITIDCADADPAALDAALPEIHTLVAHIDEVFSTWRPDSVIIMRRRGQPTFSPEFDLISAHCEQARQISRGAFDPWCSPGGVDFSGYVKGWGAGLIADALVARGLPNVCVNAAGDVAVRGTRAPGIAWSVGFAHPTDRTSLCAAEVLPAGYAAATSGFSEQVGHIVNPHTGSQETAALQASVIGPDAGLADALATALVIDGVAGSPWFQAFATARRGEGETWQALVVEAGSLWRLGAE